MKRPSYLNVVLTVIAVLLAAVVWISVAERPLLSQEASASKNPPPGVPDAGSQRMAIRTAVQEVEKDIERLNSLLAGGKLKVEVTNFQDMPMQQQNID